MTSRKYTLAEELLAVGGCLERESVFFMDAAPERLLVLQEMPHHPAHTGNTKWIQWGLRGKREGNSGEGM